jgi:hypothetical protein
MKANRETIMCDYQCEKHSSCAFYCPTMDKTKTLHYGANPYEKLKGRCFKEKEIDEPINTLINDVLTRDTDS